MMKPYYIQIDGKKNLKLVTIIENHLNMNSEQAKNLISMGSVWDHHKRVRLKNPSEELSQGLIKIYKPYYPVESYIFRKEDLVFMGLGYCIVYKKPFAPAHPTPYSDIAALSHGLEEYLKQPVFPVNRLDYITGGLIFFGLDKKTGIRLQSLFQNRGVKKWYLARTKLSGKSQNYSIINSPIKQKYKVKKAKTIVTRLISADESDFFLVKPLTGRTHQIRIHLADKYKPVWGDKLYGAMPSKDPGLFCVRYVFPDPVDGNIRRIGFLPEEIKKWPFEKTECLKELFNF